MQFLYILGIAGCLLSAPAALAQSSNGTITGSVRDSSGLSVGGAGVKLTQASTGAVRLGSTNELGTFTFPSVVAGEYNVFISAAGFKNAERKRITLSATETLPLAARGLTYFPGERGANARRSVIRIGGTYRC